MDAEERKRNPFTASAAGGRVLSAMQLPLFLLRPPGGYGVLTTTGRRTGKRRRRCVRAVRRGDVAYVVAIRGKRTGWLANALANPSVRLRLRDGSFDGRAREVRADEREQAMGAYCQRFSPFERLEYRMWRTGRPTRERTAELHRTWFETGVPIAVDLD